MGTTPEIAGSKDPAYILNSEDPAYILIAKDPAYIMCAENTHLDVGPVFRPDDGMPGPGLQPEACRLQPS